MLDWMQNLWTLGGFIPHGHCYLWKPELLWLHIISDSLIAIAYYSIPLTLVYFIRKRQDLPFNWIFLLFGSFIVACGTTHLMEVWTLWYPTYWLAGLLKAVTAAISIYTAICLISLLPKAITLPSLAIVNQELEREIADRQQTEAALTASEQRLRLTLEAAQMGIWDWNILTNQIVWSEEHERLFDLAPGTFDGSYETFDTRLHPNDRAALIEAINYARNTHTDYSHEYRVVWLDGSIHWIEGKGKFFYSETGDPVRAVGTVKDISFRKQAEADLQQYANEFEELYNQAPCGYHSLDRTGMFIRINDTELNMLGYDREEIIGKKTFADLLTNESVQIFRQNFPQFKQRGWVQNLRFEMIRKDGSVLPVTLNAIAIRGSAGNFSMSRSTMLDDTDRKQTEARLQQAKDDLELRVAERTAELLRVNQQLQQELDKRKQIQLALQLSQARFAGILEIANDAIISVDASQRISLFNQGAEKIFGYTAEAVLGQPIDLLLPDRFLNLHHQHVSGFAQSSGSARRMGERSEIFGRRQDGSEFPAEASISRLHLGNETMFTAILRDISDRKQTELSLSRFAAMIESSEDAIVSKTLDGKITSWNASAEHLYGYTAEEAIGQPITLIIPPSHWVEEQQSLQSIQQGEPVHIYETMRQRKDGTLIDVALTLSPVRDTTGKLVGISSIARDITERLQIERMKSEFISVVSHELRTPLTSLHGSLGMLASGLLKADSDQGKRMLQIAVDSTDRLVRLINDILDIERIESGRVKMEKALCVVDDLFAEAINVVQPLATKVGVTLSVTGLPIQVWADPDRIVQTLTNLLSNAIKFSPAGSTVWLSAKRVQGAGEQEDTETRGHGDTGSLSDLTASPPLRVCLYTPHPTPHLLFAIKDHGRGIPADKLDSIFERFQQVDSSDSRNHEGTGLGLAICRSIVQQHDGQIWVESVLGEGSTFFFTLPLPEIPPAEPTVLPELISTTPLVLICDDDDAIRAMLQTLLEHQNYHVITAASGQDAIAQAATHHPDVILLDLLMPGMNGWETISRLKERPETATIPIIICSICTPTESPQNPHLPDVADWVSKPLNEVSLLQSLQQTLAKPTDHIRVLIVEDDTDLAHVLVTLFEQHDMTAFHAPTGREAIRLSQEINPDLLIMDVILPEGDGFTVVEWLRQHNRLRDIPLVVYSAQDLNAAERDRLKLGPTEFLGKARVTIQEFEQRVMALLYQVTQTKGGKERQ